MNAIYTHIVKKTQQGSKQFAVLIDPDKMQGINDIISKSEAFGIDYFFVGGSLLTSNNLENCIKIIKDHSKIPVILFPGSALQINKSADAILFLSLISGRNADLLIGKHVVSVPLLKSSGLEIISTGYLLIDGGKPTTASYMSNTLPIPSDKDDIAMCTAIAGEMLGFKLIYMDAGSGAANPINKTMIKRVKENISIPLIVGGGIKTPKQAADACSAGADIIVIGNAIEQNLSLIEKTTQAIREIAV